MIKNKIVVGILPCYDYSDISPYKDFDYYIRMYEDMVYDCGGIPIGILNKDVSIYTDICDAYIWPGGDKIIMEFFPILVDAINYKKPVLGICLGCQSIATFFNILQDQLNDLSKPFYETYSSNKIDNEYLKKLEGNSLKLHCHSVTKDEESIDLAKHKITIKKDSFMYDIYGKDEIDVVSLHKYCIPRNSDDVYVSALSDDGIVEAIEYHKDNNYILGVQFHPEIVKDYDIFNWLINNAFKKYEVLVNKDNKMNEVYNYKIVCYKSLYPNCLNEENYLEEQTLESFLKLKKKMKYLGYIIDLESGYRFHESQEKLFNDIKSEKGYDHASLYVAMPYHSEHELGLAAEICVCINNKWYIEKSTKLNDFYKKFHSIIADFGFILRYPEGKENFTGYSYEPWHIRYVGSSSFAHFIMDNNKCLEEVL